MTEEHEISRPGNGLFLVGVAGRLAMFSALWWVLTNGVAHSWVVGIPVVVLATWVSTAWAPAFPMIHPLGALRFLPFFLWESWRGGLDVARRVVRPSLPVRPGLLTYQIQLPAGPARLVMVNTVSLLPGTLSVALQNNRLTLHVLDTDLPVHEELAALERRVARLFGESIQSKKEPAR